MDDLFTPDQSMLDALAAAASSMPTVAAPAPAPAIGGDDVLAASKALAAEVHVPRMTRTFLPHQAAAFVYVWMMLTTLGRVIIGHDMGLGKTQIAFAAISECLRERTEQAAPGAPRPYAILVGPPVARLGYMGDAAAAFPHLTVVHLHGRKVYTRPDADVYFIADDPLTLRAWLFRGEDENGRLIPSPFLAGASIVVRDEIHRDKGGTPTKPTSRAKSMLAVGDAVRANGAWIVGMSGTLITNRPVEAYHPMRIVGGDQFVLDVTPGASKPNSYLWRYCGATMRRVPTRGGGSKEVVDYTGICEEKMVELHDHLRRTGYCRIEKSDLGGVLPHGGWLVRPTALDNDKRYCRIESDMHSLWVEERGEAAANRMSRGQKLAQINALREEAGRMKAPMIVEYVTDLIDQGQQVVVFYDHNSVRDLIVDGLIKAGHDCAMIRGGQDADLREQEVLAFQAGTVKVCVANMKAAGVAVTLTAACHSVYAQLCWSAGDLKQTADRTLRADQISRDRATRGEGVTWHVMLAAKSDGTMSIDDAIWHVLENKARICDGLNAGRAITMPEGSVQDLAMQAWFDSRP